MKAFLNLGLQHLANVLKKERQKFFYNLKLIYDTKSKLVFINKKFNKKIIIKNLST